MKIKKTFYPKTKRYSKNSASVVITEKLDGSNIAFFKFDGQLYVAQRKNIMTIDEEAVGNYKGLREWLNNYADKLNLYEGSCICGEWIGQGHLKYPNLDKRLYLFAKGNVDEDFSLKNRIYELDYLKYPFEGQEVPDFIGTVPVVAELSAYPTMEELNSLYEQYRKEQNRDVEGFVINQNNTIRKYVRMKNGKLSDHVENVYGEEK